MQRSHRQCLLMIFFCALILMAVESVHANNPAGRWRGQWSSQTTGHRGPLHARFRQLDANHYRVVFRGRFFKVIPFRYRIDMQVQGRDSQAIYFAGQKRLPLSGTFQYQACATANDFVAKFKSPRDRGTFRLRKN